MKNADNENTQQGAMRDKRITIEDLDEWDACDRGDGERYSNEALAKLLDGRPGWTLLEMADEERVLVKDRVWVLLRPEVLGEALPGVVETIVERAVRRHALHCSVLDVERWARRWLNGEDRTRAAAKSAATAKAAWVVTAAEATVLAAAARAWAAEAANAAGWAADAWMVTARDAERRWQLGVIREVLTTTHKKGNNK